MSNDFFSASGSPGTNSSGTSSTMRTEFANVEAGFAKLASLTGNALKLVRINAGSTAYETVDGSTLYVTIASAAATYLPLAGGTLTGGLTGTTGNFSGQVNGLNFYGPSGGTTFGTSANDGFQAFGGSTHTLGMVTNGSTRVTVNSTGEVGFGQVATASYRVDVLGTIRSIGGEAAAGYGFRVLNAAGTGGGSFTAITGAAAGVSLSGDGGPVKISANSVTNIAQFGGGSASGLEILSASNSLVLRQTSSSGYAGMRIYNDQNSAVRALEIDYTGSAYASGLTSGPTGEQGNVVTTGNFPLVFGTSNTMRLQITGAGVIQDVNANELGYKVLPQNVQSGAYTLLITDRGKSVVLNTTGVTIPASVFSGGDAITIYNNQGSAQTITQGAGLTLRFGTSGAAGGNRTLGNNGICTVYFITSTVATISGTNLT